MKNKKLFLPIVITFIAVVAVTAFWFIKKNMPCKDYMSLAKYYGNMETVIQLYLRIK